MYYHCCKQNISKNQDINTQIHTGTHVRVHAPIQRNGINDNTVNKRKSSVVQYGSIKTC